MRLDDHNLIRKGENAMFDNYELLKCDVCSKEFMGRRPVEGARILCPACLEVIILPIINEKDIVPSDVHAEFRGGKGDE